MKTQLKPWLFVGAFFLSAPCIGHAQETLGGLGAAGAGGAALGGGGAGALTAGQNMRRRIPRTATGNPDMDVPDAPGGGRAGGRAVGGPGGTSTATTTSTTTTTVTRITPPPVQSFSAASGSDYVRELLAASPRPVPAPDSRRRTPRGQARYSTRVARQSKTQRTRAVQSKYKVPPVSWRAAYLPQDRYKFGKIWRFVSTEDDRFYYTPSAMARKRFNPNRVLGFNSYQDALAAGYRPDPASRPAPGAQIAQIAGLYRGPELYTFVEYVYAGQVSPEDFTGIYNYAMRINSTLRPTRARPYIGSTVAKLLEASLTGDASIIPTEFNASGPIVRPVEVPGEGGEGVGGMQAMEARRRAAQAGGGPTGGAPGQPFNGPLDR